MREERKVVTAVFADLVGSTALAERLGAEAIKLVVGEAVARIVVAVEELGGTVKDLAGDGVLALFGAPVSHEDDAERAVLAGLRIVHDIAAYGVEVERAWGVADFSVRVGVNTGPVVLGPLGAGARVEYSAFGDTVNTAARLQSAAGPGTVLVGAETHAATQPLFRWGEQRVLELKGKAEPATAFQATGTESAGTRIRGLPSLQARFIGRDRELAHARQALDSALEGAGGILLISGEPGIGKSRLLAELRHLFESAPEVDGRGNPMWLEGRCVSYGESLPYWPFRDMLREWLGAGADDPELRVRVTLRSRVDALFGERTLEIYPYLGALLGLALEGEAAADWPSCRPKRSNTGRSR
jgi:class 3 adenylate cyclase